MEPKGYELSAPDPLNATFAALADPTRRPCRLEAKPLAEATEWLEAYRRFWEASFENLDALLDEMKASPEKA